MTEADQFSLCGAVLIGLFVSILGDALSVPLKHKLIACIVLTTGWAQTCYEVLYP